MSQNLHVICYLSVSWFMNPSVMFFFGIGGCIFQKQGSRKAIGNARLVKGLYVLEGCVSPHHTLSTTLRNQAFLSTLSTNEVLLWHYRLGHPNFFYLSKMLPHLFSNKNPALFHCEFCQFAKHARQSYTPVKYEPTDLFLPFTVMFGVLPLSKPCLAIGGSLHSLMISLEPHGSTL